MALDVRLAQYGCGLVVAGVAPAGEDDLRWTVGLNRKGIAAGKREG
jgi:hypothetical protein